MKQTAVQIKICGLTRPEDCQALNESKPDYAGFVFAPSRRQVTPLLAGQLIRQLDSTIRPVGVFTEADIGEICAIVRETGLQVIQLHGTAVPGRIAALRQCLAAVPEAGAALPAIWQRLAVPLDQPAALALKEARRTIARFQKQKEADDLPDAWLLDSCRPGQSGGTGESFDWSAFKDFCRKHPVILAGGLNMDNVENALKQLNPMVVDCSSGVEAGNRKDPERIARFCAIVHDYNRSLGIGQPANPAKEE
jgi:phosphoribosylanthranilate isomerase